MTIGCKWQMYSLKFINACYIKSICRILSLPIGKNCKKKSKNTIKETLAENYVFYVIMKVIKNVEENFTILK